VPVATPHSAVLLLTIYQLASRSGRPSPALLGAGRRAKTVDFTFESQAFLGRRPGCEYKVWAFCGL